MNLQKTFLSSHRIGIIGILNSGKTVFITSMINHLMHHDPSILRFQNGNCKIVFDKEMGPENGFERFPYAKYRAEAHKYWPDKTERPYQFRCHFFRSDWHWTYGELSLLDIPGERVCDLIMAKQEYANWSDWLLEFMIKDQESAYIEFFQEYKNCLASLNQNSPPTQSVENLQKIIIGKYSQLLARLALGYRPIVTPSAFVLSPEGEHLGESISNNDFFRCHPGLDAKRAFAPLPADFRKRNPELTRTFAQSYDDYRKAVSEPLWNAFTSCNELVFLVDIATLLNANTAMYNGNRELIERIVEILSPGDSLFGRILRSIYSSISGIQRIAFVATKADLFQKNDRPKLEILLQQMTKGFMERLKYNKSNLEYIHHACSAVLSTEVLSNGHVRGSDIRNRLSLLDIEPPRVPDTWPVAWKVGDYRFRGVSPKFPENMSIPPQHLKMDILMDFLLKPI